MAPLKLLEGTVLNRQMVTAGMVRVTLGGEGLRDLASTGIADEYVRLFFPDPQTGEVVLPEIDEKGRWKYPEDRKPSHCECYTIRYARPGEIDLDFVVHGHGIASQWAQSAQPGDTITIREPHGIFEAPPDLQWLLLACDATGLPAAGRLIEEIHPSVEIRLIVEVPDASHEQSFAARPKLKVIWLHGAGNGLAPSLLPDAVRSAALPPDRSCYVWIAAEMKAVRAVRRYVRHDLGLSAGRYSATGYWTDNSNDWNERYEALDPAVKKHIDDLWGSGGDGEEVIDAVEATLEKFGL